MSADAGPQKKPAVKELTGELLASRYRIEEKLGEGAMGAVYRARHVKVGRSFAVKVLHPHLLEDQKTALRFEREAELAGRLRHLNVIGVIDVGETPEGLRYMVMDYAQGGDLAELLSEAPMPPERIISLVRQMLEGLHHAHEAGLIHRDFKPENVLVERDDSGREIPRIVDFGISILREGGAAADGTGRLTTNGLVLGTPHYMAPEQAVADPIDHRIDLFAMGIVIYEMLCGQLPFDGSGAEVARANLLLDPPPISKRVPHLEVDPLLEAFARRLMEKSRDQRPATARAARELLDLIERDRAAAAAALGVPAEAGTRGPQLTERVPASQPLPPLPPPSPSPPQQLGPSASASAPSEAPFAGAGAGTSASASAGTGATARATDLDALPYVPTAPRTAVPPPTMMTDPLPWGGRPRPPRRWLIGAAAGLAAAGAIAAVALAASGGGSGAAGQAEAPRVAMTATTVPTAGAPAPPVQPEAAGSAPAIAPSAPGAPVGAGSAAEVPLPVGPSGTTAEQPPTKQVRAPGRSRPPKPTVPKPGSVASASTGGASQPETGKPETGKPETGKPETGKPETGKPETGKPDATGDRVSKSAPVSPASSNDALEREWRAVRSAISALQKSRGPGAFAQPLSRWRQIKIQDAMQSDAARRAAADELAAIRKLLAEEQKQ